MRFQHTSHYDAAPEQVREMLTDPAFREKVCARIKSPTHTVSVAGDENQLVVTVDQTQRVRKIPPFAAKLIGETVQILQVERWSSPLAADLELTIPGKPGQLRGLIALDLAGGGTDHRVDGELKVSVPLVGGKLEKLIADLLTMFLKAEHKVGQAWLAGER